MKRIFLFLCLSPLFVFGQDVRQAEGVIRRFAGKKLPVSMSLSLDKQEGCDVYETLVKDGKLRIEGSSGVALCRGFYEYVKSMGAGISSWSGNRLEWPEHIPDAEVRRVVSPFRNHYYLNVVTYGYTMPYWDWERWEQEIDWMALHGIDMPLALVANEAISARVWKRLGLTEEEIADYFVGPAHFPWMRMGNVSGIDGPLPASWHKDQIALQHRILKRMRSLGMKPVCPGFAGFVPQTISRLFPGVKLVETSWCGGVFHNWMLSPDERLFREIGQMFVEEWEKEFGRNEYYIVDSFNEMEIPFPPKGSPERYSLLARYGEEVYASIKAGNRDAVWVMQGWMFGYQRHIWDYETLQALVSKVPDDKMMLLDLAEDYNHLCWKNGSNWDLYQGFFNKEWVYSVIPNMGGKSGLTGNLEFYANGRLAALQSPVKGRLTGYGMAPEGTENNEVLYELICDGGWTPREIDVDAWLENYSLCRYGKAPGAVMKFWEGLRKSVYGSFTDHPRYNWQFRPGRVQKGSIAVDDHFYQGIEALVGAVPVLKDSPLFVTDLTEMTAQYLGGKLEILVQALQAAYLYEDKEKASVLEKEFTELASDMDRLLSSHPTLRLERWLDYARKHGNRQELKDYYERNARRIVTVWGPPVDDYSARIWSGLIRDYYVPRWQHYFETKRTGKPFDMAAWEIHWVEKQTGLSPVRPFSDITEACVQLIERGKKITPALLQQGKGDEIGVWLPADVTTEWKEMTWTIPVNKLATLLGVQFQYIRGKNKLMIQEVSLEMDGISVCRVSRPGETGIENKDNFYKLTVPPGATANNSCTLRAMVKSDGEHDSYGKIFLLTK